MYLWGQNTLKCYYTHTITVTGGSYHIRWITIHFWPPSATSIGGSSNRKRREGHVLCSLARFSTEKGKDLHGRAEMPTAVWVQPRRRTSGRQVAPSTFTDICISIAIRLVSVKGPLELGLPKWALGCEDPT